MSKYEVISDPYSPVFGPEITSYLDTFHAVYNMTTLLLITFNRLPVLFTTEPLTLYSFYSIFQSLIWKLDLFLVLPRLLNISQCLYPFFFINFLVGRKTLFLNNFFSFTAYSYSQSFFKLLLFCDFCPTFLFFLFDVVRFCLILCRL